MIVLTRNYANNETANEYIIERKNIEAHFNRVSRRLIHEILSAVSYGNVLE